MENINEQKIARSKKKKDKVVIKFKTQKNIKKPKIKGKHGTIYKLCSPKMFNLAPMEDKYFHSSMAGKLRDTGKCGYFANTSKSGFKNEGNNFIIYM